MTQEIQQRINQISNGQVPIGYKQTKVGIVPCDWESNPVKEYIELYERPLKMLDSDEYELITVRRAYKGIDSRGKFFGNEILVKNQFEVKYKDFIISKRQISHGACGVLSNELSGSIVSNEYNVFIAKKSTNIDFFNMYMQVPRSKNLFYLMSDGVHIEKLLFKTNDWLKQIIALPPLKEQEKISEILTTQEKVIELKEKLIAEKEMQKKYLMQNLLTGKVRLSGFSGKWGDVKLGDICNISTGKLDANAMVLNGIYPFFTCAREIYLINDYAFDCEAILISGNGANVGYVHYYNGKFNAYQRTYVLDGFKSCIFYVKYFFNKNLIDRINKEKNDGNTPYIVMSTLTDMNILLPPQGRFINI